MTWGRLFPAGRRFWRAEGGAAAVEAAFILPVLVVLVLGIVEFGRLAWAQSALNFAVQEAARCASVRPAVCGTPEQTAAYAALRVEPLGAPASAFAVTAPACGIQVRAQVDHRFLVQGLLPAAPTLTAQACRT